MASSPAASNDIDIDIDINVKTNILEETLPFDDETWEAYESTILEVMGSSRVLKKDKPEIVQAVKAFLLSKKSLVDLPSPLIDGEVVSFRDNMKEQRGVFNEHYNLTRAEYDFAMRCLVYMGDTCAKQRNGQPIAVVWHKMKESGMIPRENCISTYMYVLSMDESCSEALLEVATFHDLLYSPNEKTISLRIKNLIGTNDIAKAEDLLAWLPVRFLFIYAGSFYLALSPTCFFLLVLLLT
jgi:hypothetical protein